MMELTAHALDLTLASPFRISRSVQTHARNVLTQIATDGIVGLGEAAPSGFYGERRESVFMALADFAEYLGDEPSHIEDIMAALDRRLHGNASAKASVDMALYDIMGKRLGAPVYELLGLSRERAALTSFTIGIDEPAEMAKKAAAAAKRYPVLKIKVGTGRDLEIVRAIREATDVTLRVDANAAWTAKEAVRVIRELEPYGLEFVEQPLPPGDIEGLRFVREHVTLPIIADESCETVEDIPRLVGVVDGINIKLMKCGGIHHALKMIHTARAHHMKVMLGCMIESSLAITAAAHLSPLVDYADLDGNLLTSDDPFEGVKVERGKLILPDRAGLGVRSHDGEEKRRALTAAVSSGRHGRRAGRGSGSASDEE
ncbi:MAG TPA: dipeptide epimerase [Ktedonobacterales bacterium]|nr:dipeptide epimerase [Ktedonobacterales bacterium]